MSVYIIAEAGGNHNGSVDRALELVDYASEAGCDCVKFQFFHTEKLVTASAKKAEYQIENTKNDDSQFSMLKALELKEEDFLRISGYCAKKGIDFLATPFDEEAADQLEVLFPGSR
jgi:sialic acid synthase SpsE